MKKVLFLFAFIFILTGCENDLSDNVAEACNNSISELEYYLDGKTDLIELSDKLSTYSDKCESENNDDTESTICIKISNISINAHLSSIKGQKDYVQFEKSLNDLKKNCK